MQPYCNFPPSNLSILIKSRRTWSSSLNTPCSSQLCLGFSGLVWSGLLGLMGLNRGREKHTLGKQECFDVDHQSEGLDASPHKVSSTGHHATVPSTVRQESCLALGEKSASRKLFSFLWEAFEQHNHIHMFLSDPAASRAKLGLTESLYSVP